MKPYYLPPPTWGCVLASAIACLCAPFLALWYTVGYLVNKALTPRE
jgi:hypothetical protein